MHTHLCPGCLREIGDAVVCPHCKFKAGDDNPNPYLSIGVRLGKDNNYIIGRVVEAGGDGATYIGFDSVENRPVFIREYLPESHIERIHTETDINIVRGSKAVISAGIISFIDLWQKIKSLGDFSSLLKVYDIVKQNNTAYVVCEYAEVITLREYLLKNRLGYLSWDRVKPMIMPVFTALEALHDEGIYHLGISPNNIVVDKEGKAYLTGFMLNDARLSNTDYNPVNEKGYVPYEQYDPNGRVGPWSDVYALSAVIYRMLVGTTPIDSTERMKNDKLMIPARFAEFIPAYLIDSFHNSFELEPDKRIKSIEELRNQVSGGPSAVIRNKEEPRIVEYVELTAEEEHEQEMRKLKEKAFNAELRKSEQRRTFFITFLVIFLVGAVAFGSYLFIDKVMKNKSGNIQTNSESITMPDFIGQSFSRIENDPVQNERFQLRATYEYSNDVPVGNVINQSIKKGENVSKGAVLTLVVSKGSEQITLEDYSGKSFDVISEILKERGIVVKKIERENDGSHTPGTIIGSSPAKDTVVKKGSEVHLQVWGEKPTTTTKPESTTKQSSIISLFG